MFIERNAAKKLGNHEEIFTGIVTSAGEVTDTTGIFDNI